MWGHVGRGVQAPPHYDVSPGTSALLGQRGGYAGGSPPLGVHVFLFFSNRLGCLGSLAVSALVTLVLVYALTR